MSAANAKTRTVEIKSMSGAVLYSAEIPEDTPSGLSMRVALEQATAKRAYLRGADLSDADLRGADLRGADLGGAYLRGADLRDADLRGAYLRGADLGDADLRGANLGGKKLVGPRPVLQIGPIGSRADVVLAFITEAGVMVRAGCFFDTRDAFERAIEETHGDNEHGLEYRAALALIDVHATAWPAEEQPTEAA